jgi:excisionase family DNA binding protein
VLVFTDQNKARATKRRRREEKLRLERAYAIANPAIVRTPPAVVSVNEFRKATGVSHATTHRWIKAGVIKSTKVGRRRFIAFAELLRVKGGQACKETP